MRPTAKKQARPDTTAPAPAPASIHVPDAMAPMALKIDRATQITGLSRAAIYRAAGNGKIKLLKLGRSTLVDMESARAFLAGLPAASIKAPRQSS